MWDGPRRLRDGVRRPSLQWPDGTSKAGDWGSPGETCLSGSPTSCPLPRFMLPTAGLLHGGEKHFRGWVQPTQQPLTHTY